MPYPTVANLPRALQRRLPLHAQEIYRSAFNRAWQSYSASVEREQTAHRVAWAAVKRRYRKEGTDWVPRRAEVPMTRR